MPRTRTRRVLPAVLFLSIASLGTAQDFTLNALWDSIGAGAGVGLAGTTWLISHSLPAPDLGPAELRSVNGLDRLAVFGYSRPFDVAGDIMEYTTAAIPAAFVFFLTWEQSFQIGVVYLEVLSYAYSSRSLLKIAFPRNRPWVYKEAESGPGPESDPAYDSFPSGHAVMAFAAAAFGVTTFSAYFPGSPWLVPFAILDYGLAALTGASRIFAGMHFITDVLAGTAVGLVCGLLPPYLHLPPIAGAGGGRSVFPPVELSILSIEL